MKTTFTKKLMIGAATLAVTALGVPAGAEAQSDDAEIVLLHGIPDLVADVVVDDEVVIPGFEPGAVQDLSAFAGQTLVDFELVETGTDQIAFGPVPTFEVPDSGAWTVVLHLDLEGLPAVTPFENNTEPTPAGEGRLTLRHVADVPGVDLVVGDERPIVDATAGTSTHLTLPAGPVEGAQLALTGEEPTIDLPTIEIVAGENTIVYGVGSIEADSFSVYVQQRAVGVEDDPAQTSREEPPTEQGDGTTAPTNVNTGGPLDASGNELLLAAALALFALGGGSAVMAMRRTTHS